MRCLNCNTDFEGETMVCGPCHEQMRNNPVKGNSDATMTMHPHKNHDTRNMEGSIFSFFNLYIEVGVQEKFPNLKQEESFEMRVMRAEIALKRAEYLATLEE